MAFRKAFIDSTPVLFAYLFLGIGYGMLMEQNGYSFVYSFFVSLFTFAGSAQFAMIPLMVEGMNSIYVFILIFVINARHIFYGISMNKKYMNTNMMKYYLYFGLTDETFTVINAHEEDPCEDPKKYYFYLTLLHQLYWVTGSVLGGILGSLLPFEIIGLDFILFALFLSVYTSQMKKAKDKLPGLFGLGITLLALILVRSQFVIVSMVLILISLVIYEKEHLRRVSS
ncbi:MAG: AzlC family ABC transporter permease [Candidatus Izemoplasmatales bacterium]